MILLLDNYDSFTYNIAQILGQLNREFEVIRNDKISVKEIEKGKYKSLIISPGPGIPKNAGITMQAINEFKGKLPIFGVCLGHQAIGDVFGANVIRAPQLMHGKTSDIFHDNNTIFNGLINPFTATRYHSLIVQRNSIPESLEISAETKDGIVMALRHKEYPIEGVQFHPESILTEAGKQLFENFFSFYSL
ncbi:MAG: aminodeoxychorismate/anthranilate synthase component II [Calditrichaeota bacterium]|nr:MAG: aminodeoxychorismate/anthranilate synthase component II [Calditrichota bacterium]MBL1204281.1 aminodeoxychorismate/anthranilate synthase component II [Calditrichota bacterium]NOG44111.1 aminodeoxychorismate/anthranilate synthase component II [Calditrichota bacterium]